MFTSIALQAHDTLTGEIAQTMIIPAAKLQFTRIISEAHPRSQWKSVSYIKGQIFPASFDDFLDYPWHDRREGQRVTLTMDPTGFQVTDAEYLDIKKTGELPRNVTLRYQRALEARHAVLIGKRAGSRSPSARRLMHEAVGTRALVKLSSALTEFADRIEVVDTVWLQQQTPEVARCKGGGPYRHSRNLPALSDAAEAPEPPVAPTGLFEGVRPVVSAPVFVMPVEPVAEKPVRIGEKLVRPNGESYIARKIDGADDDKLSDVEMYRRAVAVGWNVLGFGVPGTGKTAGFEVAFPGLVTMLGTAETEPADFLGQYVQTAPGEYTWVDGPLVYAMDNGLKLLVDEIGLIDTRALSILYSVMDGRGEVRVTMNPQRGVVVAKPGFGVVAATNPNAPGVRLSEALLSRFDLQVCVGTDFEAARTMGVNSRFVDAAEHLDTLRKTGELSWSPQMREILAFAKVEKEFGLVMALRNILNQAPEIERDMITAKLRERFGDIPGAARKIRPLDVG